MGPARALFSQNVTALTSSTKSTKIGSGQTQ